MVDSDERTLLATYHQRLADAERELTEVQTRVDSYRLVVQGLEGVVRELPSEGPSDERDKDSATTRDETSRLIEGMERATQERRDQRTDGPRGEDAVRRVLEEKPREGFTLNELYDELVSRGWVTLDAKDPRTATRAAANRLRKKDSRYELINGKFVFVPSGINVKVFEGADSS